MHPVAWRVRHRFRHKKMDGDTLLIITPKKITVNSQYTIECMDF